MRCLLRNCSDRAAQRGVSRETLRKAAGSVRSHSRKASWAANPIRSVDRTSDVVVWRSPATVPRETLHYSSRAPLRHHRALPDLNSRRVAPRPIGGPFTSGAHGTRWRILRGGMEAVLWGHVSRETLSGGWRTISLGWPWSTGRYGARSARESRRDTAAASSSATAASLRTNASRSMRFT